VAIGVCAEVGEKPARIANFQVNFPAKVLREFCKTGLTWVRFASKRRVSMEKKTEVKTGHRRKPVIGATVPRRTYALASERAMERKMSLSAYVCSLIEADLEKEDANEEERRQMDAFTSEFCRINGKFMEKLAK
jgi:hypothetical protein